MKHREDGYVLVYVLVVIVLLAALVATAGTLAVRNMTMQRAAALRTQEKYEAVGMVERMQAHLDGLTLQIGAEDASEEIRGFAEDFARSSYPDAALRLEAVRKCEEGYQIALTAQRGEVQIAAELIFSVREGALVFVRFDAYAVNAIAAA